MRSITDVELAQKEYKLLQKIKKNLDHLISGGSVFLFGSRARGDSKDDSDWDILIITENINEEIKSNILKTLYDIELEENVIINPLILSRNAWENGRFACHPIHAHIESKGILLTYE